MSDTSARNTSEAIPSATRPDSCHRHLDQESFFTLGELKRYNFRHYVNEILRHHHLLTILPQKMTNVIDIGCGTGYMAYLLARRGKEVTAVDISEEKLSSFRNTALKHTITQVHSDLFQLDYNNSFDALICQEVLEHLENYEKAVRHMTSFLKPHGYALFCVPYNENLAAKMRMCPVCNRSYHKNGHVHSFSGKKFLDSLEKQGLKILRTKLIVSKRTTKWLATIRYPVRMGLFLGSHFDNVMNSFFPRKAAYLAALCTKNSS